MTVEDGQETYILGLIDNPTTCTNVYCYKSVIIMREKQEGGSDRQQSLYSEVTSPVLLQYHYTVVIVC